jgi:hypothetical protein
VTESDVDPVLAAAMEADGAAGAPAEGAAAPVQRALGEFAGTDLAGVLNEVAAKLTGTKDLPGMLKFGEAGAATAERATGTASPEPWWWFLGSGAILAAVGWWNRRNAPAQPAAVDPFGGTP